MQLLSDYSNFFLLDTVISPKPKNSPNPASPKGKVVRRQIINESHPIVQQLVEEFEYELEPSIDAVRLCGGDLAKAMNYLETRDTDIGDELLTEFKPAGDIQLEGDSADEGCVIIQSNHFFFLIVYGNCSHVPRLLPVFSMLHADFTP